MTIELHTHYDNTAFLWVLSWQLGGGSDGAAFNSGQGASATGKRCPSVAHHVPPLVLFKSQLVHVVWATYCCQWLLSSSTLFQI